MSSLTEENINTIEKFIEENSSSLEDPNYEPSISMQYFDNVIECWKYIQEAPETYYFQFASNAMGMSSFGFYKAKSGTIYIVEAFMNNIQHVCVPSNRMYFMQGLVKENNEKP